MLPSERKNWTITLAKTGKVLGPLHGLPISLKDCFDIPGYPTSVGFTAWAADPVHTESTVVSLLKDAGAVFYVKTNVLTGMMFSETVNNCYGRTMNPFNRTLTSGGSSGGESALIAMRGSCLGSGQISAALFASRRRASAFTLSVLLLDALHTLTHELHWQAREGYQRRQWPYGSQYRRS